MTIIRERLEEAIASKKADIKSFVWKGEKKEVNGVLTQEEIRLIDADENQLKKFYNHCMSMLYNEDKQNPGRYLLLNIIKDQIERCNCELFLRWLEQEKGKPRFTFLSDIRTILDNNKDSIPDTKSVPISAIVGGCPDEFKDIPISLVIEDCIDRLGYFNKQHITLSFIVKQGLWFTQQELKDLTERNEDGTIKDRSTVSMMNIKIPNNVEKQWDDDLKQYYIEYASGKNTIKMWIEDGTSIKEKVALVAKYKLGGTSGWRKDMETSNVWVIIKEGLANASE